MHTHWPTSRKYILLMILWRIKHVENKYVCVMHSDFKNAHSFSFKPGQQKIHLILTEEKTKVSILDFLTDDMSYPLILLSNALNERGEMHGATFCG